MTLAGRPPGGSAAPPHLDALAIAKLLSGRLSPPEAGLWVPHLLATCPQCRAAYDQVQRLTAESGHWDEWIAVSEGLAAPERVAELAGLSHRERVHAVEGDPRFQTWAVCRQLLERGKRGGLSTAGVEWSSLAARVAEHLAPDKYGADRVRGLRAEAVAALSSAYRLVGEELAAEEAGLSVEVLLGASPAGRTDH